jgi:hypothetical protein
LRLLRLEDNAWSDSAPVGLRGFALEVVVEAGLEVDVDGDGVQRRSQRHPSRAQRVERARLPRQARVLHAQRHVVLACTQSRTLVTFVAELSTTLTCPNANIHTYHALSPKRHLRCPSETPTFYQNYLAMSNTSDVKGGERSPSQGVNAIYPLVAFYDIHGRKRDVLFFYFIPPNETFIIIYLLLEECRRSADLLI